MLCRQDDFALVGCVTCGFLLKASKLQENYRKTWSKMGKLTKSCKKLGNLTKDLKKTRKNQHKLAQNLEILKSFEKTKKMGKGNLEIVENPTGTFLQNPSSLCWLLLMYNVHSWSGTCWQVLDNFPTHFFGALCIYNDNSRNRFYPTKGQVAWCC